MQPGPGARTLGLIRIGIPASRRGPLPDRRELEDQSLQRRGPASKGAAPPDEARRGRRGHADAGRTLRPGAALARGPDAAGRGMPRVTTGRGHARSCSGCSRSGTPPLPPRLLRQHPDRPERTGRGGTSAPATPPGRGSCSGYSGDHRGQGPAAQVPEPRTASWRTCSGASRRTSPPSRRLRPLFERYGFTADAEQNYRASVDKESRNPIRSLCGGVPGAQHRSDECLGSATWSTKTAPPEAVIETGVAILAAANPPSEDQQRRAWGLGRRVGALAAARLRPLASQPGELAQPAAAV